MKKKSVIMITLLLNVVPWAAFGFGGQSSGGAFAVVCREKARDLQSVALLDLFEARERYGLTLPPELPTLEEAWKRIIRRRWEYSSLPSDTGQPRSEEKSWNEVVAWMKSFHYVTDRTRMPRSKDTGFTGELPTKCALEQLAFYDDRAEQLYINLALWNELKSNHQAALLYHEMVYRFNRRVGDLTSAEVRKSVAYMVATDPLKKLSDLVPEGATECYAVTPKYDPSLAPVLPYDSHFYLVRDSDGNTRIIFSLLFGRYSDIPSIATVPFFIAKEQMESQTHSTAGNAIVATNPKANYEDVLALENGAYEGYHLHLVFRYQNFFTLNLLDPQGKLVRSNVLRMCF